MCVDLVAGEAAAGGNRPDHREDIGGVRRGVVHPDPAQRQIVNAADEVRAQAELFFGPVRQRDVEAEHLLRTTRCGAADGDDRFIAVHLTAAGQVQVEHLDRRHRGDIRGGCEHAAENPLLPRKPRLPGQPFRKQVLKLAADRHCMFSSPGWTDPPTVSANPHISVI